MSFGNKDVIRLSGSDLVAASELLAQSGLRLDDTIETTLGIKKDGEVIATGSIFGKVIKCLAVDEAHRGEGLAATIVTALIDILADKGIHHQFIFTKPETAELLNSLGFTEISRVGDDVVLLEGGMGTIHEWCAELAQKKLSSAKAACVVVNANPLTKGHLHLLKAAHDAEGALHILVVSTERSAFPYKNRQSIIEKATAHWENTVIHRAGDYIVSMATFPAYFTREEDVAKLQALLDVKVFCQYVVPALGITARYVGEEPYCPITHLYNEAMQECLPQEGVEFHIIPRIASHGKAISASRVRQILRDGGMAEDVRGLVPEATYQFLLTSDGREVITAIREKMSRH